jgi:hypothetical protein
MLSKKIRKIYKKNNKSRFINKNKMRGGITLKKGKYGFFCNYKFFEKYQINSKLREYKIKEEEKEINSSNNEFSKNDNLVTLAYKLQDKANNVSLSDYSYTNAPSVSQLNKELSLCGYRLENNTNTAKLILSSSQEAHEGDPASAIGMTFRNASKYSSAIVIVPFLVLTGANFKLNLKDDESTLKRTENQNKLNAEIIFDQNINLDDDEQIQKVFSDINKHEHLKFLKINCCVVIDINPIFSNKFIKIVNSNIKLSNEQEVDSSEIDIKKPEKSMIEIIASNTSRSSAKSNSFSKPGYAKGRSTFRRK